MPRYAITERAGPFVAAHRNTGVGTVLDLTERQAEQSCGSARSSRCPSLDRPDAAGEPPVTPARGAARTRHRAAQRTGSRSASRAVPQAEAVRHLSLTANLRDPSVGLDAATGGILTGWEHVVQSLRDIFDTRFGSRIMREWYGSFVPNLLGRLITPDEVVPYFAAITSAIEQWEPRFRVTRIEAVKVTRDGQLHVFLEGEYRPRAVYGDFTAAGARRLDAYANPDGMLIEERLSP